MVAPFTLLGEVMLLGFYLRVETLIGTFRLPSVSETMSANTLELIFNWVVFEQPMVVKSIQTFAEVCGDDSIINSIPLDDKTYLDPSDSMYCIRERETGCFESVIPLDGFSELADMFLDYCVNTEDAA
jgi:hypothetical protein